MRIVRRFVAYPRTAEDASFLRRQMIDRGFPEQYCETNRSAQVVTGCFPIEESGVLEGVLHSLAGDVSLSSELEHSSEEFESAALCEMLQSTYSVEVRHDQQVRFAGGCRACGALAEQVGSYGLVAAVPVEGLSFYSDEEALFVRDELADRLAGVVELIAVRHSDVDKGRKWFQVPLRPCLPPMHPRSTGFVLEDECRSCGRSGWATDNSEQPIEVWYSREACPAEPGVFGTFELFGVASFFADGTVRIPASPQIVVSQEIVRAFGECGEGAFRFRPVRLI